MGVLCLTVTSGAFAQVYMPKPVTSIAVDGQTVQKGMPADRVFEVLDRRYMTNQTIGPDPRIAVSLLVKKYYRIDGREYVVDFRRAAYDGPYITSALFMYAPDRR